MTLRSQNFKRTLVAALAGLLPVVSFSLLAAESEGGLPATPAMLTGNRSSLENRIQFPAIAEDTFVVVLCNAVISRKGKFSDPVYCYRDEEIENSVKPLRLRSRIRQPEVGPDVDVTEVTARSFDWYEERFEREVVEAGRISRIEPARLYGKRVEVKINFAVRFVKDGDRESIDVFMHHFRNSARLGTDYIAAQRFNAQKRLFQSARPNECPELHVPVWITSTVMFNGTAYNVKPEKVGRGEEVSDESVERCVAAFTKQVKDTLFVPAMADNTYVSSHYTELFYDDVRDDNAPVDTSTHDGLVEEFKSRGGSIL